MATNQTPEPLTFSELYDLRVSAQHEVTKAQKTIARLQNGGGRTNATTHAIERHEQTIAKYDALVWRVQAFIEVKLEENDR
jgi:hypothetical protein